MRGLSDEERVLIHYGTRYGRIGEPGYMSVARRLLERGLVRIPQYSWIDGPLFELTATGALALACDDAARGTVVP